MSTAASARSSFTTLWMWALLAASGLLVATAPSVAADPVPSAGTVPVVEPVVIAEIPHDPTAYTEGLQLDGAVLYEGTGRVGESQLRELDPDTGAVRRAVPMPNDYFGEGIAVLEDRIWQLTYREGVAVEWDKATLTPLREINIGGENWGMCPDGDRLIQGDGTDRLLFRDASNLAEIGSVAVTLDGQPVTGLNELECVGGQVWANVWPTDTIVRIDQVTGKVNLVVDASGLWRFGPRTNKQVLNGIAYLGDGEYLLTGKYWPSSFRVTFPA